MKQKIEFNDGVSALNIKEKELNLQDYHIPILKDPVNLVKNTERTTKTPDDIKFEITKNLKPAHDGYSTNVFFWVGQKFGDFQDLEELKQNYENKNKIKLFIYKSQKLSSVAKKYTKKRRINNLFGKKLVYNYIIYRCEQSNKKNKETYNKQRCTFELGIYVKSKNIVIL